MLAVPAPPSPTVIGTSLVPSGSLGASGGVLFDNVVAKQRRLGHGYRAMARVVRGSRARLRGAESDISAQYRGLMVDVEDVVDLQKVDAMDSLKGD